MSKSDTESKAVQTGAVLRELNEAAEDYASQFLDLLLPAARQRHASDVHLQPTPEGLSVAWRIDGVLQPLGVFASGAVTDVITRLKVMASLLTYKNETPQEGRIPAQGGVEMRVSTFPTLHGERATIRLFTNVTALLRIDDLDYDDALALWLRDSLRQTAGALLVTGPAGSGKTTTLYACLRELVSDGATCRSIITMEDPIESAIDGVAQTQVHQAAGLTLATGIRSLVRQDPEVMMIGEIRDADSARAAIAASLTGHLVLTSFHAGSCLNALRRLRDMGLEPYMLRNGLFGIVNQRLARRLCTACAKQLPPGDAMQRWGVDAQTAKAPVGCDACLGTGYCGRLVFADWLDLRTKSFPEHVFAEHPKDSAQAAPLWAQAIRAVEQGRTSPAEARRVLG